MIKFRGLNITNYYIVDINRTSSRTHYKDSIEDEILRHSFGLFRDSLHI